MARKRRFSGSQARKRDLDTIRELNYLLDEKQVAHVLSLDAAQKLVILHCFLKPASHA